MNKIGIKRTIWFYCNVQTFFKLSENLDLKIIVLKIKYTNESKLLSFFFTLSQLSTGLIIIVLRWLSLGVI